MFTGIKLIIKSEVLTKQEKIKMIVLGFIECILTLPKKIIILPFTIVGIIFATLEGLVNYVSLFFGCIEQVFHEVVSKLQNLPEVQLTKGQTREKLLTEIKQKKYKII